MYVMILLTMPFKIKLARKHAMIAMRCMTMENKWDQVVDYLLEKMQGQEIQKDEQLPSEHVLVTMFELTRMDIRRAYQCLKELGYVYSIQGKGNFYAGNLEKFTLHLSDEMSFSKKMASLKERFTTRLISCERIDYQETVYQRMRIAKEEVVYCIKRLRYIDEIPSAMHVSYVRHCHFPNLLEELNEHFSLFTYFKMNGFTNFSYEKSRFTISTLDNEERQLMKLSGVIPCLILESINVLTDRDDVLEYSMIIYRGDKFIFEI